MNSARGEKEIKIGGAKFTFALEYERIVELEELLGVGIIAMAGRVSYLVSAENVIIALAQSPVTLKQVVQCVWVLSGKAMYDEAAIGKLVLQEGITAALDPLSDFFATAIAGAPTEESKAGGSETTATDSQ